MVSEKGTRARDRDFQFRNEHRRARDAFDCTLDCRHIRLVRSLYHYRRNRFYMARFLARVLPSSRGTSDAFKGGTRIYSIGPGGTDRQDTLEKSVSAPADVGVCRRKISDRPDLVGLSFLAARFFEQTARVGFEKFRHSARRHLYY